MRLATGDADAVEEFKRALEQANKTGIEVARGEIEPNSKIVEAKHAY